MISGYCGWCEQRAGRHVHLVTSRCAIREVAIEFSILQPICESCVLRVRDRGGKGDGGEIGPVKWMGVRVAGIIDRSEKSILELRLLSMVKSASSIRVKRLPNGL